MPRETCETARRRPKCRDTSASRTSSNSIIDESRSSGGRAGGRVSVVEGAVDMLERGDQLLALGGEPVGVASSASPIAFDLHQVAEQLLAARQQAFACRVLGPAVVLSRARPDANEHDRGGGRHGGV